MPETTGSVRSQQVETPRRQMRISGPAAAPPHDDSPGRANPGDLDPDFTGPALAGNVQLVLAAGVRDDAADRADDLDVHLRGPRAPGAALTVAGHARGRVVHRPQPIAAVATRVLGQPLAGEELLAQLQIGLGWPRCFPGRSRAGDPDRDEEERQADRGPSPSTTDAPYPAHAARRHRTPTPLHGTPPVSEDRSSPAGPNPLDLDGPLAHPTLPRSWEFGTDPHRSTTDPPSASYDSRSFQPSPSLPARASSSSSMPRPSSPASAVPSARGPVLPPESNRPRRPIGRVIVNRQGAGMKIAARRRPVEPGVWPRSICGRMNSRRFLPHIAAHVGVIDEWHKL